MLCTIYTITFSNGGVAADAVAMGGTGTSCVEETAAAATMDSNDYIIVSFHFIIQIFYDCILKYPDSMRLFCWKIDGIDLYCKGF